MPRSARWRSWPCSPSNTPRRLRAALPGSPLPRRRLHGLRGRYAQPVDGRGLVPQWSRQLDELLHLAAIDCLEQRLARREMAVKRADADPGAARHGLQAGLRAAGTEDRLRGLQQALAVANRVGARPP